MHAFWVIDLVFGDTFDVGRAEPPPRGDMVTPGPAADLEATSALNLQVQHLLAMLIASEGSCQNMIHWK